MVPLKSGAAFPGILLLKSGAAFLGMLLLKMMRYTELYIDGGWRSASGKI